MMAACVLCVCAKGGDAYFLSGIVRDSVTLEPLPMAYVAVEGQGKGTLTDENGIFELTVSTSDRALVVTCLGYNKRVVPIKKNAYNLYDVQMTPSTTMLDEVVVRKEKYSKKNNPAVEFARRIRDAGPLTDPERNPYYSFRKHSISSIGLNDFVDKDEGSAAFKKFPFLWEHVDTSEISGKPVLIVVAKEKVADEYWRADPQTRREVLQAIREDGIDEVADQASVTKMVDDVLREIDIYDEDITLFQNRFVSPLSRIAPDFYRFYLTDTVEVDGERCVQLSFYPRNSTSMGFNGQIYVPVGDSTLFVKKVTMRQPRGINLNFVENVYISQQYARAPDGSRLKVSDDLVVELRLLPGTPGVFMRRSVGYSGHTFDPPADMSVFDGLAQSVVADGARERDEAYWEEVRMAKVTDNERRIDNLMEKLRSVKLYYWGEKVVKVLVVGYVRVGKNPKIEYGPVNTTISHNWVEGWRFRVGGITTANLNRRLFARGYVAYGVKDHRWKYKGELEWSFVDKVAHSREFPIHSLRLTSLYDVDQLGAEYLYTNSDNFFLSLKRMPDRMVTYHNVNKLEYTLELPNNFSVVATLKNEIQRATPWVPFVDGYGQAHDRYMLTSAGVQLRYAPGEKFYQARTSRVPINLDAPVFTLTHVFAPGQWPGNDFALNVTQLSVHKRFWLSAFGHIDAVVKGGHVWSRSPYPNLLIPNANVSYIIQPESFALMNPMEFVNDTYASWDLSYNANGAILNYIPYIKDLKLREVFGFRGLWGHLSHRNNPTLNPGLYQFPADATITPMTSRPYLEASVGLDNIFKYLRVDYAWRLTYTRTPYAIDRHGLRVALQFKF